MGTWGTGLFENDVALDWMGDFLENPTPAMVKQTLEPMITPNDGDWGMAMEESRDEVLAAGELVAAVRGNPSSSLPEELREWADANRATWKGEPLFSPALRAVTNVRDHADEVLASWGDPADAKGWLKNVNDLLKRLS